MQQSTTNNFSPALSIRSVSRLLLVLMGSTLILQAQGQADKRLVLADQYFASGEFYTAAHLYGQFLNPAAKTKSPSDFPLNANRNAEGRTGKYGSRTDILFKQAESYRLANYWVEATALYKECFQKDSSSYSAALYWLAVCQKSTGNYLAAEESIDLFLKDHADGNILQQDAIKEKTSLVFIRQQLSRPDVVLFNISKVQSSFGKEKGFFAAVPLGDQMILTSTDTDSVGAGRSPYFNRLFTSSFNNGQVQDAQLVQIEGLDLSQNQGAASISADGNFLYFTQWKKEEGKVSGSIYYSRRTANGWSAAKAVAQANLAGFNSKQPNCSADGKYLYFSSDRPGGAGGFDIWYAPLLEDGSVGEVMNAGAINTAGNEQSPFYHQASATLVFSSDGMLGMGGYDLFMAKGEGGSWKTPENMGHPVNSSRDDIYFFSTGKKDIMQNAFLSSDRGSECCLATYAISKTPKKQMVKGVVRDCENEELLADVEVTMTDPEGRELTTRTAADGSYQFEFTGEGLKQIAVAKEQYIERTSDVVIERVNENEWHTDTLFNNVVCMEKKKLVIKVENVVSLYFDFDRFSLKERARTQLDSIYQVLMEDTTTVIQISGYTDGLGSAEYNAKLSDKRARSCADYLVKKGIDPARISFESFGACCPVEMELLNGRDNPDGRSMNRRALINIDKRSE